MNLGLGLSLTSVLASGGGTPAPTPTTSFAFDDTSLEARTGMWNCDITARSPSHVLMGYSKTGGEFAIAEHNPITGAVVDARIILDEPTLYTGINDHFIVIPHVVENGAHAGTLWCMTVPHGPATVDPGNRRLYTRYSLNGRTNGLEPADNGAGLDYVQNAGGTLNLGHFQERSDGRLVFLTIDDDASPQCVRAVWTDDPAVVPIVSRPSLQMADFPAGGAPQLYINGVPGETADTMRVFSYLHPSVPDGPIVTFTIDLATGQLLVGGVAQGSGSIYDTSGTAMLDFGDAAQVTTPTGGLFTRIHDVCQFGTYEFGHAVAFTQGVINSNLNEPSHYVMYCDPANDPEVEANWTTVNIGAANRARSWDNGNNRRYNSDISFLQPKAGEGIRIALIAYDGISAFRIEVWAGASPDTVALVEATDWDADPRPIRIFPNLGAGDGLEAFVTGYTGTYTSFTDFTPAPVQLLRFTPAAPVVVTPPDISVTPVEGIALSPTDAVVTGSPFPVATYQWQNATDTSGTGAANISGATSATYPPDAGDVGKSLRRVDTFTNSQGVASSQTNWSALAIAPAVDGWDQYATDYAVFDPTEEITLASSRVSDWGSAPSVSNVAMVTSQATALKQPLPVAGPPARFQYGTARTDSLFGDTTARDFFKSRSAVGVIFHAEATGSNSTIKSLFFLSAASTSGRVLFAIRRNATNFWELTIRRLDGDSSISVIGPAVTVDTPVTLAAFVDFGAGGSTASLWVDGVEYTGTPTSGAAFDPGTALAMQFGGGGGADAQALNGEIGAIVLLAKDTGGIRADAAAMLAKYDTDFPRWT